MTPRDALDYLAARIEAGRPSVVEAVNPEKVLQARENPWLLAFIEGATLRIPDGTGLLWASGRLGGRLRARVTGVDLFDALVGQAARRNWPVYLLGGRPGVAEAAAKTLGGRYPGFRLAGCRDGYFKDDEAAQVARDVGSSGALLLFVAMGSPRQEQFLADHFEASGALLGMGVGGSFDVLAGRVRRAPEFVQAMGLEWLFRFLLEPRTRLHRTVRLVRFAVSVLREASGRS